MLRDELIDRLEQLAMNGGDCDAIENRILAMFDAEQNRSKLFSKIVGEVAAALGQKIGETTHDLGEKVTALRTELGVLRAEVKENYDVVVHKIVDGCIYCLVVETERK